jgi:hypothetical protein
MTGSMTGNPTGSIELYRAEALPLFQNVTYDTADEARACACGDVVLVQDAATALVSNSAFRADAIVFDARYQNEQALSAAFRTHLDRVADIVTAAFAGAPIVEIGCGKGTFLRMLSRRGATIRGFDPAYEGDDPAITPALFTGAEALAAEGIVLRHVLEHIADPLAFLSAIAAANGGKGRVYIEVPCLDWIIDRRAWFDVFYEHVNYFRLSDLHRMFGRVHASGHLFGGQYLYAVADLASLRTPRWSDDARAVIPDDFRASLDAVLGLSRGAAVWGGASKGVIFSLVAMRAGAPVSAVIDINPAKQNRFLPVTGLAVLPPAEGLARLAPGATVLVMNGNYRAEIETVLDGRFRAIAVDDLAALRAAPAAGRLAAMQRG